MNILKSGGTLFLAYEGRMGRASATSLVIKKYYKSLFSLCKKSAGTDVLADYFSNLLDLS